MVFQEDDWNIFTKFDLARDCRLLILNMIASTCGNPLPDEEACRAVRNYCETGKNLLLLHGSSAAFWSTLVPLARVAAISTFTVAPTLEMGKLKFPPGSRPSQVAST